MVRHLLLIKLPDGLAWSTLIIMNKLAAEGGGVVWVFFPIEAPARPPEPPR